MQIEEANLLKINLEINLKILIICFNLKWYLISICLLFVQLGYLMRTCGNGNMLDLSECAVTGGKEMILNS